MKQLTEKQAIEFAKSEAWKDWTSSQIVLFQLFQKKLCMPFDIYHAAVEKELGRSVQVVEFGFNDKGLKAEFLGLGNPPTMEDVLAFFPKDKLVIFTTD